MSAPNIAAVSYIYGKSSVQQIGTSATAIVSNSAGSGKVLKINSLYVGNVDGTNNANLTVDLYRSSTAYRIASGVVVPALASLDVLSNHIYLEEGDSLRLTANASGDLEAVCSYEEIY